MPKTPLEKIIEQDKYEEAFPQTIEARAALAAALALYPGFTLPDPLHRCTRCGDHAALYSGQEGSEEEGEFFCGVCAPRVSIFVTGLRPDDLRQVAADAALREQDEQPEPDTCEKCRGDIKHGEERHLIYGAVWCAACADDPDQYDRPEDYAEQRGLR